MRTSNSRIMKRLLNQCSNTISDCLPVRFYSIRFLYDCYNLHLRQRMFLIRMPNQGIQDSKAKKCFVRSFKFPFSVYPRPLHICKPPFKKPGRSDSAGTGFKGLLGFNSLSARNCPTCPCSDASCKSFLLQQRGTLDRSSFREW